MQASIGRVGRCGLWQRVFHGSLDDFIEGCPEQSKQCFPCQCFPCAGAPSSGTAYCVLGEIPSAGAGPWSDYRRTLDTVGFSTVVVVAGPGDEDLPDLNVDYCQRAQDELGGNHRQQSDRNDERNQ